MSKYPATRTEAAKNLKLLRVVLDLTQWELGVAIGESQTMICHYERGTRVPSIGTKAKLEKALKCQNIWEQNTVK